MFDMIGHLTAQPHQALVTRVPRADDEEYLILKSDGRYEWTSDPMTATAFPSMREATRAAFRLPASLRAFGLLRDIEIETRPDLH